MDLLLTTYLLLDKLDYVSEPHANDICLNAYHVPRAVLNPGTTIVDKVDTIHVTKTLKGTWPFKVLKEYFQGFHTLSH